MILGIDASNIRSGGGVTHLVELLRAADPRAHGFSQVIVWSGQKTLDRFEDRPWLARRHHPWLDKSLFHRVLWQRFVLRSQARMVGCGVLFVPGGTDTSSFRPMVAMSQNLLPFQVKETLRYRWSWLTLKFLLLGVTQKRTFERADGVIFLTHYAKDVVLERVKVRGKKAVISHGVDLRFFRPPRVQRRAEDFNAAFPCRLLYVSIIDVYKHQWCVAEAVSQLRASGFSVVLDLVGPAGAGVGRLKSTLRRVDPEGQFVFCRGAVPHQELHELYADADIAVFASTCETFGQVLTEAMSAGLPIACSNRAPMTEILGNAGAYFDPERPADIARAIRELISSPERRTALARSSIAAARRFSWSRCADETFGFIRDVSAPVSGEATSA